MRKIIELGKVEILLFEWPEEPNPKLRFSANINFEFPVPNAGGHEVMGVGTYGTNPNLAAQKAIASPTVYNYIKMKAEKVG